MNDEPQPNTPAAEPAPATLSEAMVLIQAERVAAGETPITSGAALEAEARTRFGALAP